MSETPQCYLCKHYKGAFKCEAFDGDIPDEILYNQFDHRNAYKGDHGIRMEPMVPDYKFETSKEENVS